MASQNNSTPASPLLSISSEIAAVSAMLYNGKSDRSRGWKSRSPVDMAPPIHDTPLRWPIIKRFDGARRCCSGWDNLSKDPELWFRNGNCYVYLYAKGESQRGPSFRVPFAHLLDARCQPLIEAFIDRSISETEAFRNDRVNLYIPVPQNVHKLQAYWFCLAFRNLFAWIFRRSVVGEHLGYTLISLANCLEKYRQPGVDNMKDLLAYLDEEGYLDLRDQPTHALGILHLAEAFQMSELYLEAFAHCAGMSDRLHNHNEYSCISSISRKLVRHARVDMDFRLSRAGAMLSDLLLDELSEAHIGLSVAARAHLDRFRAYIHGFYATRFGSYPPGPSNKKCRTIFKPEVYRIMLADFAALYEYLVDEKYTFTADRGPSSLAQGGLCTLQLVQEFDCRHKFAPLPHPVPLLPEVVKGQDIRRRNSISWLVGGPAMRDAKGKPGQRLLSYASLMRATNHTKTHALRNRLVIAYRQYEESSLATTHKAEVAERASLGPADARKVRWLLIYAVYQTLLSCAEPPSGLNSNDELEYHLNIPSSTMPPWEYQGDILTVPNSEGRRNVKSSTSQPTQQRRTVSPVPLLPPVVPPVEGKSNSGGLNIQPDVDHFALTHPTNSTPPSTPPTGPLNDSPSSRTLSLKRNLSIRKSLSWLYSGASQISKAPSPSGSPSKASMFARKRIHREITVRGGVNGTHEVSDASYTGSSACSTPKNQYRSPERSARTKFTPTRRSESTSSRSSYMSAQSRSSAPSRSSFVSSDFSSMPASPMLPLVTWQQQVQRSTQDHNPHEFNCNESITDASTLYDYEHSLPSSPSYTDLKAGSNDPSVNFPTRSSSFRRLVRSMYSNDDMLLASSVAPSVTSPSPPPVPRRSSKRNLKSHVPELRTKKRWSMIEIPTALREEDTSSAYDSASDHSSFHDRSAEMQPQPLRIRKGPSPVQRERPSLRFSPVIMEMPEDVFVSSPKSVPSSPQSGSTELWTRNGLFTAPPRAWEQFYDLGGLHHVHPLLR